MLLTAFDPWKSQICTCPDKLTFNPYTGCDHKCLYCYASSYIPNFFKCRPKKNLLSRLRQESTKLKGELISISNSSDPYPRIEKKLRLTRECLEILVENKYFSGLNVFENYKPDRQPEFFIISNGRIYLIKDTIIEERQDLNLIKLKQFDRYFTVQKLRRGECFKPGEELLADLLGV